MVDFLGFLIFLGFLLIAAAFINGRRRMKDAGIWMGVKGVVPEFLWNKASLQQRKLMLLAAGITEDSPSQEALLSSRWTALPHRVQLDIFKATQKGGDHSTLGRHAPDGSRDDLQTNNPSAEAAASKAADVVAASFSSARFADFFGGKEFRIVGWESDDALGVWHCLGYFCYIVAVTSEITKNSMSGAILDPGLKHLLQCWQMPPRALERFEKFNRYKLAPALDLYQSISDGTKFQHFLGLFVCEILGSGLGFTRKLLHQLAPLFEGKEPKWDVPLYQSVVRFFVAIQKETREQIRASLTATTIQPAIPTSSTASSDRPIRSA